MWLYRFAFSSTVGHLCEKEIVRTTSLLLWNNAGRFGWYISLQQWGKYDSLPIKCKFAGLEENHKGDFLLLWSKWLHGSVYTCILFADYHLFNPDTFSKVYPPLHFSFVSTVGDLYSVQFHYRNILWRLMISTFPRQSSLYLVWQKQNKTKQNKKQKTNTRQRQNKNKNKKQNKKQTTTTKKQLCSSDCKIPLASTKCKLLVLNAKNELYIMWVYKLFDLLSVTV